MITDKELKECKEIMRDLKGGYYYEWDKMVKCYTKLLREVTNCHSEIARLKEAYKVIFAKKEKH